MTKRPIYFVLLFIALAWMLPATGSRALPGEPRQIEIVARSFEYSPSEVTLKRGEPVVIRVKGKDTTHGMLVQDLGINLQVPKGGVKEIQITPDKTGDFAGICSVFCGDGHAEMSIVFHVVD